MSSALPAHLSALLSPQAYPHPVRSVQLVETHISWVFLTGEIAYKIKRPVRFPFVDLRSPERRAFFCSEELRLNRRFAPYLYLDVCDVTESADGVRIDGEGRVIERAVKMQQFDRNDELDMLLTAQRIEPPELERFGRRLAQIHATLPTATPSHAWGRPADVPVMILDNLAQCAQASGTFRSKAALEPLRAQLEAKLRVAEEWIAGRYANGRTRECHGDLHTRNIVRRDGELVAFDCMEFEPAFRWIDVADEIAFLLADLGARHRPLHAAAFLNGYLAEGGDYDACRHLRLYVAHRALVRAKVVALSANDAAEGGSWGRQREEHARYLEGARRALSPANPLIVLMSGLSGSGKTWLAERIAPLLEAVHLRSDVERKRLAGLTEYARSQLGLEEGLYSSENTERVYDHLVKCTRDVLTGGYSAVIDGTFSRRAEREKFRRLAAQLGAKIFIVRCQAPREVLAERIEQRAQAATDASEANLGVLAWQEGHFEPYSEDEGLVAIEADTTQPGVALRVARQIGALSHDATAAARTT